MGKDSLFKSKQNSLKPIETDQSSSDESILDDQDKTIECDDDNNNNISELCEMDKEMDKIFGLFGELNNDEDFFDGGMSRNIEFVPEDIENNNQNISMGIINDTMNEDSSSSSYNRYTIPNKLYAPKLSVVNKISDFELIRPIGEGGYGRVDLYKKKTTGDEFAIKTVDINQKVIYIN